MNKISLILSALVLILSFACSEDDESELAPEELAACQKSGPPAWVESPSSSYENNKFQLHFKTDIPATIYYVISDTQLDDKNPEGLKNRVLNDTSPRVASKTKLDCNDLPDGISATMDNLPKNEDLYGYVIAESYQSDTLLQNDIFSFSFSIDSAINCEIAGPPTYVKAPEGLYGRTSFDFKVRSNIPASFYYIISDNPLSDTSPENIRQKVLEGASFLAADSVVASCDDLSSAYFITVDDLPKETKLYAYIVAESYKVDTVLQDESTSFEFTTASQLSTESYYSSHKGRNALYVRYLPDEAAYKYRNNKIHPLIIFLGGNGEVAPPGEIDIIKNGSIPKYISDGNEIPFIVIAPEHNEDDWNTDFIHEVVEYAKTNYSADPDRVIITGMSGGGIGTWYYALAHPEIPAAIVPISGESEPEEACNISHIPTWAFHNDGDPKVPVEGSIDMINALKQCDPGPAEAKLTVFADEGHNCWIRVYNPESNTWEYDPSVSPINIYDWMYSKRRN